MEEKEITKNLEGGGIPGKTGLMLILRLYMMISFLLVPCWLGKNVTQLAMSQYQTLIR